MRVENSYGGAERLPRHEQLGQDEGETMIETVYARSWGLLLIGVVVVSGCSSDEDAASEEANSDDTSLFESSDLGERDSNADYSVYDYGYTADDEGGEFDEDAARDEARQDLALEGYDYSYGCTMDCSGHEAGWQWGAENGVAYGNSQSFHEGTMAFEDAVEDRVEEMRDEFESEY